MDFVLLFIELKKLALRGLRLAVGLVLPLAILNLSLGATIMLATPPGFETSLATGDDREIALVHMQMFGGLIHLHDGSAADHLHHTNPNLPPGVTEEDTGQTVPTGINPAWNVTVSGADSAANFWQDLTVRGQANPIAVPNFYLPRLGREISGAWPYPTAPYLAVPLQPPTL
jgi:hypothetical protein